MPERVPQLEPLYLELVRQSLALRAEARVLQAESLDARRRSQSLMAEWRLRRNANNGRAK
jgi:hypothetical protein